MEFWKIFFKKINEIVIVYKHATSLLGMMWENYWTIKLNNWEVMLLR